MDHGVELVLIRHLPTDGNGRKAYVGWSDEPIRPAVTGPADEQLQTVYGSDLLRARQTAELLYPGARYVPDSRFRECNFGEFEGKTYAQLENNTAYRRWVDDPLQVSPPDGESLLQMEKRVTDAFRELPAGARVVTHGGPIRLLLDRFAPDPLEFWEWDVPHGSRHRLYWASAAAWKEGRRCTSYSAELPMENGNM
ncbi:histidine phosphatase family protein [Sporosarcina koreensis]|uniref:histidine phosphatase family protein n=1 Tax=Sporosarcina koreensis TaxID=334735 RepID=UPI00058B1D8D|nr:histidine phosphatase family protein [Sporosarcina koreensis]